MQLSGLRWHPAPSFVNHTPKEFEITPVNPPQSPVMFAPAGIAVGAGPLFTNAIMGQAPSAADREAVRKASSSILREDSIYIEEEQQQPGELSRPGPWSMHYDRTDQAHYLEINDVGMNTETSLPRLPKDNPSADLAFFLRTTGPTAPHRRPSNIGHPRRGVAAPKKALRLLKLGRKRPAAPIVTAHDKLNGVLRDEGGLLSDIIEEPMTHFVEQRKTSSGQRYLAVKVKDDKTEKLPPIEQRSTSPDVQDSRVSIAILDDLDSHDVIDHWYNYSRALSRQNSPAPARKSSAHLPLGNEDATVRVVNHSSSPIRPAESNPLLQQPDFAVSMIESYFSDLTEHRAKRSFDACRALTSHPVRQKSSITALPKISMPKEEFPVEHANPEKEVEIKHPSPRRFMSHPVLLQRASSIASSLSPRSVTDSPGPPPPRSPLRLRRDPRTIESIIATHSTQPRTVTPLKQAPSIEPVAEYNERLAVIKPTVITDCTGPIKRPKSRTKNAFAPSAYPVLRKEREERIRARKLHDRPFAAHTIDAIVNAVPPARTRRLRKERPQIQIPDLKPAPSVTRASSSGSSDVSWKKVTETTRTPVSPVPSQVQGSTNRNGEKTGYTPVSSTISPGSRNAEARIAFSPVMLVAEEIPVPKTKPTYRPAKSIGKEAKSYAARPRSASIPRNALKRRSRTAPNTPGQQTPPRSSSPACATLKDETPPLPSPPPNRALPPTPPASGSEKPTTTRTMAENKKELPVPPMYEILPKQPTPPKHCEPTPHVATQAQRKDDSSKTSRIDTRLEALERQNKLLEAALYAVLKTNGSLNLPLSSLLEPESPKVPTAWESRIARRSAASQAPSHAASSSNGSALEMYMSTRRGSGRGCGGA